MTRQLGTYPGPTPCRHTMATWMLLAGVVALSLSNRAVAHAHAVQLDKVAPPLFEYFRLGVEHILTGWDHLVFLLGVVLIATGTRSVLAAVTAFTVAHSLTLALSVLGFVSVSPRLVEPLIAASVAYVGLENFWTHDASRRYRITFAFGLVHGFGFAGALAEIGLPADRAAAALACFNSGVEAGQLLVLSALWPLLLWLRHSHARAFMKVSHAVNLVIVVLGMGWAVERSLGGEPAVATDASVNQPQASAATSQRDTDPSIAPGDVHSVYATVATSPLAERMCHMAQRFPREQRAECAGAPVGVTFDAECTRMLSAALANGAIKPADGLEGRCFNAIEARYATCDFMQASSLSPIAACTELWQGQLAPGAVCRSSLECQPGLYCHGASPTETGTCGTPKPPGASCGASIDALATYLPHTESDHKECAKSCAQSRCL